MAGGETLIADAAGNDLLVADGTGNINWVATFPEQNGAQAVPTSVVIGPDGAYYVGEPTGFPATPGLSRVWRVAPGTLHAHCGTSPACSVVATGLTSIIDLAFGPDGKLYVAQLEDASWLALEGGGSVGGSVHACDVATGVVRDRRVWYPDPDVDRLPRIHALGRGLGARPRAGRRRPAGAVVEAEDLRAGRQAQPSAPGALAVCARSVRGGTRRCANQDVVLRTELLSVG